MAFELTICNILTISRLEHNKQIGAPFPCRKANFFLKLVLADNLGGDYLLNGSKNLTPTRTSNGHRMC